MAEIPLFRSFIFATMLFVCVISVTAKNSASCSCMPTFLQCIPVHCTHHRNNAAVATHSNKTHFFPLYECNSLPLDVANPNPNWVPPLYLQSCSTSTYLQLSEHLLSTYITKEFSTESRLEPFVFRIRTCNHCW